MRLQDRLDLKRRFPGYFHVWVFRVAFLLVLFLFLIVFIVQGPRVLQPYVYAECPAAGDACLNVFYLCKNDPIQASMMRITCGDAAMVCDVQPELCVSEYWPPGVSVGEKPPAMVQDLGFYVLLIFFGAFALNHYIYWRNKRK